MPAIDLLAAARTLGGEIAGQNRIRCPGPGHSRADRSLSVTFTNGGFVVHSFAGDSWKECRDHIKARLGLSDDRSVAFNDNPAPAEVISIQKRRMDALSIWERSSPITGTLAETYLVGRSLSYDGNVLRFWHGGRAMVALITDAATAEPIGIHRTLLDADGRRTAKKMLGRAKGGVVRLSPDEDVCGGLAIAEGVETALAAMAFGFRPIWASLSAGNMAAFPPLAGVEALTIFADNDASGTGQRAALACAERWHAANREVTLVEPKSVGADIADILREAA